MGYRRVDMATFLVRKVSMLAAKLTAINFQRSSKKVALAQCYLQIFLPAQKYDVAMDDEFSHLSIMDRDP